MRPFLERTPGSRISIPGGSRNTTHSRESIVDATMVLIRRRAHRGRVWLFGALTAFLMTVPLINLITPVLATAAMVHLFERLPRRAEYEALSAG